MNGKRIKHHLLDSERTLFQLAMETGLTYDRLIKIVNGYRQPTGDEVSVVARALGVRDDDIR